MNKEILISIFLEYVELIFAPEAVLGILVQSRQLTRSLSGTGQDNEDNDNADTDYYDDIDDILPMSPKVKSKAAVKLRMVLLRIYPCPVHRSSTITITTINKENNNNIKNCQTENGLVENIHRVKPPGI